jgi:hypothetical protein
MANSLTIRNTLNWCAAFLEQQPVLINGQEPAMSSASLVLQTVLGPPFSWPFNRGQINYVSTSQDMTIGGLGDFGFLEGGSVTPPAGTPYEIAVRSVLQQEGNQARPMYVSELINDGAGNITFRLNPKPPQNAAVNLIYQRKAPLIHSMGDTWTPFPDEKNYVPQWGFLSLMSLITNDARFNLYNQKFITALLAQQGGLSALERNIFLTNWTAVLKDVQAAQLGTNERFKAREV